MHHRSQRFAFTRLIPALCAVSLIVTACGFHLRGVRQLSPEISVIYLSSANSNSLLVRYLRQQLQASGAQVTKTRDEALSVLEILVDSVNRRVLSVGSTGKVREYELHYVVTYRVLGADGKKILPRRELAISRVILFDETDVLGKTNEAGLVRREMQQDLARMIMRQLELASA
ncbi:MAG: LPS assembly lipoprotein LptE [Gammaproteobacteria bacterium]